MTPKEMLKDLLENHGHNPQNLAVRIGAAQASVYRWWKLEDEIRGRWHRDRIAAIWKREKSKTEVVRED